MKTEDQISKIQTIMCWLLVIVDGLAIKYVGSNFWESILFVALGAASAAIMLQGAELWRKE
jgi:hypothetical protein